MEKHTNILSLKDLLNHSYSLDTNQLIKSALRYSDNDYNPIKNNNNLNLQEVEDLITLFDNLDGKLVISQYSGYFLNTTISQGMREQFDALRFSENSIINIELKSAMPSDGTEGIKSQLVRHRYILSLLGSYTIKLYTYISQTNLLYTLDESDELIASSFDSLQRAIPQDYLEENLLSKIDTTQMIISPYSDPDKFTRHVYFLNDDQKKVKTKIKDADENLIILKGGAGSGKSLVLFDLASEYTDEGLNIAIVFSAKLTNITTLNHHYDFDIISTNDNRFNLGIDFFESYDVILIDESQRLYSNHSYSSKTGLPDEKLQMFLKLADEKKVIFSIDHNQSIHNSEISRNNEKYLCEQPNAKTFCLTQKVRSNKQMNNFIRKFLNLKQSGIEVTDFPDVSLNYFLTKDNAKLYTDYLMQQKSYEVIELSEYITKTNRTLKRKKNNSNSTDLYEVFGQEFDNVALIIDSHYEYDNRGLLQGTYNGYYPYNQTKSILQAITRVRKNLDIVVIDNPEFYEIVQKLLTWREDKANLPNYHHFNFGLHTTKNTLQKLINFLELENEEELISYLELNNNAKIEISLQDLYNHLINYNG